MKLCVWRDDVDVSDARRLLADLSGHREHVWSEVSKCLHPEHELKARYAFDNLWGACMIRIEEIAEAVISGDALRARSLSQDFLASHEILREVSFPQTCEPTVLSVAAALIELFAQRNAQDAPEWSSGVGSLPEPLFLLRHAASMPQLRRMCEEESPEPLRRRRIFAPANYFEAA